MDDLDQIKVLLSGDKVEQSFNAFIELIELNSFDSNIDDVYDKVILLSGQYKSIEKKITLGILSVADEIVEKNKIRHNFIQTLNDFSRDVKKGKIVNDKLTKEVKRIRERASFAYDIFMSFSSNDLEIATNLYDQLRGYGFNVFISSEFFKNHIGSSFQEEIEHALTESKYFLLLWTNESSKSKWVKVEYMTFFNEFYMSKNHDDRNLFIVNPDKIEIPLLLRNIQVTDNVKYLVKSIVRKEEGKQYPDRVFKKTPIRKTETHKENLSLPKNETPRIQSKVYHKKRIVLGWFISVIGCALITYVLSMFLVSKYIMSFNNLKPLTVVMVVGAIFFVVSVVLSKIIDYYKIF